MDSRPTATQASKGRRLFRSAIAEAVASDPAQRVLASIRAPGRRSRTPIWVGLGVVVALTAAVTIGTMLRTGTPGGVTSATSAPADAATPSAQAPAMPPATAPSAAQAGAPVAPADTGTPVSTWDKVAQCESGGNWATSTGNGFHGGLQFTASTWRSFGGSGMPHQASRTQQVAVAERVRPVRVTIAAPVPSSALANALAVTNRSAGTFSSAVSTASSTCGGTVLRSAESGSGSDATIFATIDCAVGPVNGGAPASISYVVAPSA